MGLISRVAKRIESGIGVVSCGYTIKSPDGATFDIPQTTYRVDGAADVANVLGAVGGNIKLSFPKDSAARVDSYGYSVNASKPVVLASALAADIHADLREIDEAREELRKEAADKEAAEALLKEAAESAARAAKEAAGANGKHRTAKVSN